MKNIRPRQLFDRWLFGSLWKQVVGVLAISVIVFLISSLILTNISPKIQTSGDHLPEWWVFYYLFADAGNQMSISEGSRIVGMIISTLGSIFLNEQNVRDYMQTHSMCVVAAHGDSDGVYNENNMPVVSLDTANYNFQGKGFYGISCLCAQKLRTHLLDNIGALLFVGYKETFNVRGEYEPFITCALSGLKCLLEGKNVADAYQEMLLEYEKQIDILDIVDPMAAKELLHNMESLVFCGNKSLVLNDLN